MKIGIKLHGGVVAGPIELISIPNETLTSLPQLYAPYIFGSLVKKQPTFINEQYRFATPINGWADYYVILSGGVINNEGIEVIQITSSTLASVKNIINNKYNDFDNISTYKIYGNIELIPTPVVCGIMTGVTNVETEVLNSFNNIENGILTSLHLPESRYNKNVLYLDLDNDKTVNLKRDKYFGLYSRNSYERVKSAGGYSTLFTTIGSTKTKLTNNYLNKLINSIINRSI